MRCPRWESRCTTRPTRGRLVGWVAAVGGRSIAVGEGGRHRSEELRGDDRAAHRARRRSARGLDGDSDPPVRLLVWASSRRPRRRARGRGRSGSAGRGLRRDLGHEPLGVRNVEFLGNSARCQLGQERMQATDHPSAMAAEVPVALRHAGAGPHHVSRLDASQFRSPKGRDGDSRVHVGVVLVGATRWRELECEKPRWAARQAPLRPER